MGWFKRHWSALVSAILLPLPILRGLIQLAGDADFIISRIEDPGWIGDMMHLLTQIPGWLLLALIFAGLVLIYWDYRRSLRRQVAPKLNLANVIASEVYESDKMLRFEEIAQRWSQLRSPNHRVDINTVLRLLIGDM